MTQPPARELLDDVARDRIPDNLDLLPRIAAHYEKQKGSSMKPQFKFALAVLLVLAVLAVISFTVPPVATAMRHVLGYVPGLGLVEQGEPLRVLAEPVSADRDGINYIVDKGSSDSQRTILLVSVRGFDRQNQPLGCTGGEPRLRLAGGKILAIQEATGFGSASDYNQRMVFPPLPIDEKEVVLEVPCLLPVFEGKWPENWQIPLRFVAAGDSQLAPVIELSPAPTVNGSDQPGTAPTQPAASSAQTAETIESALPAASPYGIAISLDKVVDLEDGYILLGSLSWTDALLGDYGCISVNPTLLDADGKPVSFEEIAPDSSARPGGKRSNWAYKVHGKQHRWPLTLKTDADVTLGPPAQPSFALDLSSPPAPGESKDLNIDVELSDHTIEVLRYSAGTDAQGNGTLEFSMQSDSKNVMGASLYDLDHPVLGGGGGGGGGGDAQMPFTAGFTYNGLLPTGQVRIGMSTLMLYIEGDWSVTWQP